MKGKHIIVGVSAGIAAYKAIEVVSRLAKSWGRGQSGNDEKCYSYCDTYDIW